LSLKCHSNTKKDATTSMKEGKILVTSKVGPKYRITLVKGIQEKLKVKVGDAVRANILGMKTV